MRYTPPIKGLPLKKSVKKSGYFDVGQSVGSIASLVNELNYIKDDIINTVDRELEKVDSKIEEVDKVIESTKEIKEGPKGEDADEQKIADWVLSQIRQPEDGKNADQEAIVKEVLLRIPPVKELDEKELIKRLLLALPENKASLKVIQEKIEVDTLSFIDKLMALPEKDFAKFRIKASQIDGLQQTINSFRTQLQGGYLHGGGDTVVAGDNITIVTNPNGTKTISSTGGLSPSSGQYKIYVTVGTEDADYITGDYASDDLAIQAAIDDLPTRGGVVFIKQGTYNLNNKILIKKHAVWLKGEAFATNFADQINQQPGITGLTRLQTSASFPASTTMIQFGELGTSKMWTGGGITNILLIGSSGVVTPGNGVDVMNVQSVRVQSNGITKVAKGVTIQSDQSGGVSNVLVEYNIIYTVTGNGIYTTTGSEENYIRFNYISGAKQYGIRIGGIGNTLINNHIEGVDTIGSGTADGTGIYSEGRRTFIYQNDILTCDTYGIYANNRNTTIISNDINNPNTNNLATGAGIWIAGSPVDMAVIANSINDNDGNMIYGIYDTTDVSGGAVVEANQISGEVTEKIYSVNGLLGSSRFLSKVAIGKNTPVSQLDILAIGSVIGLRVTVPQNNGYLEAYTGVNKYFGINYTTAGFVELQSFSSTPMVLNAQGNNVGIGTGLPTAVLHLKAGTASAGSAPIKLTSGTLLTSPEIGAIEFLTDKFYGTITTGSARQTFVTLESSAQTFTNDILVPDEAYGSAWNGSLEVPTKNAVYDKIQTIASDVLFDHFTDANNGTTVETDLYSDTLAAAQLATNGEKIIAQYGGTFVGDATSTQRLKAYFGGTLIFDTGALGVGVSTTNWDLYITMIRVSSSVVRCSAALNTSFASLNAYAQYTEVTGLTLANTQIVKITGTAAGVSGASNQITAKEGYLEFKPSA